MDKNIEEEIKRIIAEVAECELKEISCETDIYSDLDIDSLKIIEVVTLIEKRLGASIREEQVKKLVNIQQIIDVVRNCR